MNNFDYIRKTIDIFEDSLLAGTPFTTTGVLAARIGYSAHHLGRLFQALCGISLGRYVLQRRLTEAVVAIRDGRRTASAASLLYGWEDYSAFSRAVRKEFGVSPSRLSTIESDALPLTFRTFPRLPEPDQSVLEEPALVLTEALHVSGLVFFMGMNEKGFHKPWRIFMKNLPALQGVVGKDSWQFSSWDNDATCEDDGLWIHCAVRTDPSFKQDLRFFSRDIPALTVLRFIHAGPIERIHDIYRRIFDEYLPGSTYHLAGNLEFQHYREDGTVEICIPVNTR